MMRCAWGPEAVDIAAVSSIRLQRVHESSSRLMRTVEVTPGTRTALQPLHMVRLTVGSLPTWNRSARYLHQGAGTTHMRTVPFFATSRIVRINERETGLAAPTEAAVGFLTGGLLFGALDEAIGSLTALDDPAAGSPSLASPSAPSFAISTSTAAGS